LALALALSLLAALVFLGACSSSPTPTPTEAPPPTQSPPGTLRGSVSYHGPSLGGYILVQLYRGPAGLVITSTRLATTGGEYVFSGLSEDDYYVHVWLNPTGHPGAALPYDLLAWYDPDGDGQPNPITVPAGGVGDGGTIVLHGEPAGTAQGTVYGTVTYTGVQSAEHWLTVRALSEDRAHPVVVGETSCFGCLGAYTLPVSQQRFTFEAWLDVNDNGLLDRADPTGCFRPTEGGECSNSDLAKSSGPLTVCDITLNDPGPQDRFVLGPVGGPTFAGGQVLALVPRVDVSGTVFAITGMTSEGLYWTTANAHIRRTTDGGATWRTLFTTIDYLRGLAVLSDTLLAVGDGGWDQDLIVLSTDNGLYWTTVFTSTWTAPGYGLRAAAILPGTPRSLFAAGWQSDMPQTCFAGVILRSTDDGTKWDHVLKTALACGSWYSTDEFLALAIAPHQEQTVFAAGAQTREGKSTAVLYRSDDRGDHWTLAYSTTLAAAFTTVTFDPLTPTVMYLGAEPSSNDFSRARRDQWEGRDMGLLFRSTDGGRTWALAYDQSGLFVTLQPNLLYASTSTTARRAEGTITPTHWLTGAALPASAGPLRSLVADPFVPGKLYAGTDRGGVYVSLDGGASWVSQSRGMRTMVRPVDIVVDPVDRRKLFVAGGRNGGFLSRDDGTTWTQLTGAPEWYSFAVDPTNPQVVLAGVGGNNAPSVLRSSDGGRTWTAVFTLPSILAGKGGGPTRFPALAFSPSNPQVAYAGGWESIGAGGTRLLTSSDSGRTWTSLVDQPVYGPRQPVGVTHIAVHPTRSEVLFAAGDMPGADGTVQAALWRSVDGGQTWEIVVRGDQPGPNSTFTDVVLDPHDPDVVYAASGSQVLKSADGGVTWQVLRERKQGQGSRLALDPLHPQLVYSAGIGELAESTNGGATWTDLPMPKYFYHGTEVYPGALTVINRNGVQGIYVGTIGVYVGERPDPVKE
jgi:photosystem II stability/assembly factor-like uncharacterized protein